MVYTQLVFYLNPSRPSHIFRPSIDIFLVLSFKSLQNVLPTLVKSVIPRLFPGSAMFPVVEKFAPTIYPFSPPLGLSLVFPYPISRCSKTIMEYIPSPPYFINKYTFLICHCGLPTAKCRYTHIYFFLCELPRQPISTTHGFPFLTHLQHIALCPRVGFFTEFCVERFVGCGCSYLAVVLYKYFPLPTTNHINILCSQGIAITVSASPPCWPSIPFTPAHACFFPLSKSSFVFQIMSFHNASFFILVSTMY